MRLLLALLVLIAAAAPALPASAGVPFDPFGSVAVDTPEDARVPGGARFTDRTGAPVDLAEVVAGDVPVVLAPVYYDCPNICTVSTASLVQSLSLLTALEPGTDYRVVFFSFDPREGPGKAREALAGLKERRFDYPGLDQARFLSGPPESIEAVTRALGYRYAWDEEIQQYSHANAFAVLTPDGRVSRWINAISVEPTDLRLAIVEAGNGAVGDVSDFLLMLCYQYDPTTGKYGPIIDVSMKAAAGITLAVLFGFIGLALWREHRNRNRRAP
ncbi:SCO1/SenC family protein [Caenispirillum salinarum AK4]|uniref:SCO1/SenC family protein n=1 Tax=Caenispirillum salinarum AK4 TaxID=1238182 RepID=K9H0K4_9PROT|nr:SCO family protein [Caenispirillum salinarum]EKV31785.1 SCO1/SenC family protein [Caenispirillum salinarum AK4]